MFTGEKELPQALVVHVGINNILTTENNKILLVRPILEQDSEYNRLNSSHNKSDHSKLSFDMTAANKEKEDDFLFEND